MRIKAMRHLGALIALVIASVFVAYMFNNIGWGVFAFFAGGFLYLSGDAFIYQCRMLSTGFFANIGKKGHSSIIEADMFDLQAPYKGEPVYKFMMAGGSSVPILPFHGFGPLFICPKAYVKHDFHGAILAIADWTKVRFDCLPETWQNNIITRLEHFNPKSTDIYFAETSKINEKMKGDVYINLSATKLQQEAIINSLTQQNSDLRTALQEMSSITREIKTLNDPSEQPKRYKMVKVEE